jgi:hypothetical protein
VAWKSTEGTGESSPANKAICLLLLLLLASPLRATDFAFLMHSRK